MERMTGERRSGIKSGYWTSMKKEEVVQRLGAYEDTGLMPEEIQALKNSAKADDMDFEEFLEELSEELDYHVRNGSKSVSSLMSTVLEILCATAGRESESSFTASQIKQAAELAKEKSA